MSMAASFIESNGTLLQIIAAAVIALATGLFGWLQGRRNKRSKTFDYQVLSDVSILSHRPDDDFLKVTYMDAELENPRVVRVRFANTGTDVIRASDVLEAYVLTINAQVVSMMVSEWSSRDLATFTLAVPDFPTCEVHLTLSTLNPGDNFTIQMIVDSAAKVEMAVTGRIEGQTRKSGPIIADADKRKLAGQIFLAVLDQLSLSPLSSRVQTKTSSQRTERD
ncbi:hypothetical protein [Mycobacteroides abscessus]|uniref:hypothetical protein n=2 Tax=Mycobacteroides abscessus TaxID=36809 RepID=UPI00104201A6|nr:hypothetical protein [Mycobacteroides abscessus]